MDFLKRHTRPRHGRPLGHRQTGQLLRGDEPAAARNRAAGESGSSAPDGTPVGSPVTLKNLDAFTVVDLSLKYPLWKGRSEGFMTAGVENLFDENYKEEYGFPQPGQTFFITAEVTF